MTLKENIEVREVLRREIKAVDMQLTDLTREQAKIAHEMRTRKDFTLLHKLEQTIQACNKLRKVADNLEREHFALIKQSAALCRR